MRPTASSSAVVNDASPRQDHRASISPTHRERLYSRAVIRCLAGIREDPKAPRTTLPMYLDGYVPRQLRSGDGRSASSFG